MGLRTWTQAAIEDGGTVHWLVGLSIKLLAEGAAAALFGLLGTGLFFVAFSPATARVLFGSSAFEVVWIAASLGLYLGYTRSKFTREESK